MSTFEVLLSHHPKEEQFKCIQIKVFKKRLFLCSRCLGFHLVYFPLLLVFIINQIEIPENLLLPTIFFLPAITYIDWILTKFKITKSNNYTRIVTGVTLGIAGATMTYSVLTNPFNIYPYISVAIFFSIAGIVYSFYKKRFPKKSSTA